MSCQDTKEGNERLGRACECWFLDVGQGSSNVILLGGNRAVVIDCGPKSSRETVTLLKEKHVDTIECLAITHNHEDHDGNVSAVLSAYVGAVRNICFLNDRSTNIKTLTVLNSDPSHEKWPIPRRLETEGVIPKIIYSDETIELSVVYPNMQDNLNAVQVNQTSAVLLLKVMKFKIVFSGDVTFDGWKKLATGLANPPLKCDVLTVSHHGGHINDGARESWSHDQLYSQIVNPQYGIISVGTSNTHNHPSKEALAALVKNSVKVMCTQMTEGCCKHLEDVRAIGRVMKQPSRSTRKAEFTSSARKSKNVACCGTVVAEINGDYCSIEPDPDSIPKCFAGMRGVSPMCEIEERGKKR